MSGSPVPSSASSTTRSPSLSPSVRLRVVDRAHSHGHPHVDHDDDHDGLVPLLLSSSIHVHEDTPRIDHKPLYPSSSSSSSFPYLLITALRTHPTFRNLLYALLFLFFILVSLYFFYQALDQGRLDADVDNKMMVIYCTQNTYFTRVQGAFSDFMSVIGALLYARDYGAAGVKIVYENPLYMDPHDGRGTNYFDYFYEPNPIILKPEIIHPQEVHFNKYIARFGAFGTFTRYVSGLDHSRAERAPFPISAAFERTEMHQVLASHIRPKPFIQQRVKDFMSENFPADAFFIGVHYRGSDKGVVNYPYMSPSYAVFDYFIRQVKEKYPNKKYHLFVASDEKQFIDYMLKQYPGDVSYQAESPRADVSDKRGVHKTPGISNYDKGLYSLTDALLLARSNYIIKNRSSLSDVALIWNPLINFTMVLGKNDPCWSTDHLPCPPLTVWETKVDLQQIKPAG